MKTLVCFGTSSMTDYCFLAPLTALMWRDFVGHSVRVFLIGTESRWRNQKHTAIVLDALKHFDIDFKFAPQLDGFPESTCAQNVRQHAAADINIAAEQWVMMTDADLWPIRAPYYHQHKNTDARAVLLYSNGDHSGGKVETLRRAALNEDYQSIPTCHVIMRALTWREMYRYPSGNVVASMGATLTEWLAPKTRNNPKSADWQNWMSDQRIITERLCEAPWFPDVPMGDKNVDGVWRIGDVLFVTRRGHPPLDRLDRSCVSDWRMRPFDPSRWVDAHLHKDPFEDGHWEDLLPIVDALLPQHAAWARGYQEAFVRG